MSAAVIVVIMKILINMTQYEIDILSKDLCARLPYGVKLVIDGIYLTEDMIKGGYDKTQELYGITRDGNVELLNMDYHMPVESIKPYLLSLSSMTEEQKQEYTYIVNYISPDDTENWKEGEFIYVEQFSQLIHFYHINHLDYMGLIPMGLANDATGLNIY